MILYLIDINIYLLESICRLQTAFDQIVITLLLEVDVIQFNLVAYTYNPVTTGMR